MKFASCFRMFWVCILSGTLYSIRATVQNSQCSNDVLLYLITAFSQPFSLPSWYWSLSSSGSLTARRRPQKLRGSYSMSIWFVLIRRCSRLHPLLGMSYCYERHQEEFLRSGNRAPCPWEEPFLQKISRVTSPDFAISAPCPQTKACNIRAAASTFTPAVASKAYLLSSAMVSFNALLSASH